MFRSFTSSLRLDVVDRAVALRAGEREAPGDLLRQRTGDRRLRLHEPQVAVVQLEVGSRREARLARRDVDGAGRGVLAEQRALRSAQHLDLIDVEEVERRRRRPRVEHAVDVEADARLEAVVGQAERRAEAADVDRRVARVGRVELHRRDHFLQAVHVERAGVGDQIAAHDRHRNRHVLRRSSTRRAVTTTDWVKRAGLSVKSTAAVWPAPRATRRTTVSKPSSEPETRYGPGASGLACDTRRRRW